jgi:molybdate transport system substrate-binding protein
MPPGILIPALWVGKMKRFGLAILLVVGWLAACGPAAAPTPGPTAVPPIETSVPPVAPRTLTVFAAASLTGAFTETGSQTLSTQLTQGAVADVFASANHMEMDKLVTGGLVQQGAPKDFLTNKLVVILPKDNPANVQTLQDLTRSGLKLVLADATVPAGKYARQILDTMSKDPAFGADFGTKVLANVVSNETDVKQVVAKVQLGEADAGIVYISDSIAAPELKTVEIPANYNVIARYPIAALVNAPLSELASEFIAYVLSADGQAVLKKWGFTPITP